MDARGVRRKATKDARTKAQVETAARLCDRGAAAAADATLRPWLELERLGYAAETQADLAKADGEAREILEAIPRAGRRRSTSRWTRSWRSARPRSCAFAATRRSAPAGLADRAVALFRAPDRRRRTGCSTTANRSSGSSSPSTAPPTSRRTSLAWIRPDDVDNRWRIALAWI